MKKNTLIAASSLLALFVSTSAMADGMRRGGMKDTPMEVPGIAYSANIEASAGWSSLSGDGDYDDKSYPLLMGAARVTLPMMQEWAAQLDLEGMSTFTSRSNGENNMQTYFITGAHLARRDPSRGALGVFGAVGSSNGGAEENATFYLGGLEAQRYLGNWTLYAQGGVFSANDETEEEVMTKAWFVRGVARYFINPNARLQLELAHADGESRDGGESIKALNWGARFDRQMDGRPFAWFAAYDGLKVENDGSDVTDHRFRLGLVMNFGTNSLFDNDRRGSTFDLPDVGRWTGYTMSVID